MFSIDAVPAFNDNYIWVIHEDGHALAVDPGEAAPLEAFLQRNGLTLDGVLVTHHHGDHTGGIAQLAKRFPGLTVHGPATLAGVTAPTGDGRVVHWRSHAFRVLSVPGHTLDHLAYYGEGRLFCGDTLFGAGCGRVFEGTAEMMFRSLQALAALPADTLFYPAHEYTLSNLAFAVMVEPANTALRQRLAADSLKRERGEPTLPATLAGELATNPFLRTQVPEVIAAANTEAGFTLPDACAVFATLRSWKNRS